ncbi:flagellar motor protein MotB [Hydrogenovibrio marinus]|uniref:OmpA/MotB protein n=1 Tax=Hydrogenovibrio marinus TaxID=28885 RepID=A0A066ZS41_HYDMR|nr:flagellar motor protein MotB [Hydrogenovibrio marinus]KDN96623.1 OmpA/MotB protein [Hydrogenovibrio marinus]BBN60168.1 flagellar motor protein MotB [Hydrogenovibrio marinus]
MAKKTKPCPEWMATFADLMSLLMAVFVLLFSMSTIDAKKYESLVESLTNALGFGVGLSPSQVEYFNATKDEAKKTSIVNKPQQQVIDELHPLYESLIKTYALGRHTDSPEKKIDVSMDLQKRQIKVLLPETISFSPGRADLKTESFAELDKLRPYITNKATVKVIGHTDKRAVTGGRFRSNWELSSARAAAVVEKLIEDKIVMPKQVEAIGVADTQPISNEETEAGFAKNRRVEIVIIPKAEP